MKIFILDDDLLRLRAVRHMLSGNHDWTIARSGYQTSSFYGPYHLILLDHDLGMPVNPVNTGLSFIKAIKHMIDKHSQIVLHSWNPDGAAAMAREIQGIAPYELAPFGSKKFFNQLHMAEAFLGHKDGDWDGQA